MKSSKRKKKRSRGSPPQSNPKNAVNREEDNKEVKDMECLIEAFSSASLDEISSAYRGSGKDPNKAAEILSELLLLNGDDDLRASSSSISSSERFFESTSEDPTTSSNFSSSSSDRLFESDIPNSKGFRDNRQKRVVASTGTVSTVLGKEYVRSSSLDWERRYNYSKGKGHRVMNDVSVGNEEAEQFLFSLLGDGCELSMAVIRDVFCQCGYDVEKALEVVLDLSASPNDQNNYGINGNSTLGRDQSNGMMSEPGFGLFERENREILRSSDNRRNYSEVLLGPKQSRPDPAATETNLPQKVLESLFSISQSSEANPDGMNWKNVVKKIESFGQKVGSHPTGAVQPPDNTEYAQGEEYQVFREAARLHWEKMRFYFQKAATAYSRGEKDYAAHLSEQGRAENRRAHEADEKASKRIFEARNKGIQNILTIDLHGQHVKQAIRVLKVHLVFMMHTSSVQLLRVITGCGVGKGKLKQSVIGVAEKAGAEWKEENQGIVLIKLVGGREYSSFLESDSDSE